jgi:hypothetical protein
LNRTVGGYDKELRDNSKGADNTMNPLKVSAAALAFGVVAITVPAAAQTDALTTTFFEKNKVAPRNAAKLRATISNDTISIKTLKSGAIQQVYYGARRIDTKGQKSEYSIGKLGIEEEVDGVLRMLVIYDWRGHTYGCLANVGEGDELEGQEGSCPYEIVGTARGNQTGRK